MVHLFVQSAYTLLQSTVRIEALVKKTKEYGYNAVALTDFHVMRGIPAFLKACEKEGIKGIIGLQVTVLYHEEKVLFLLLAKDNAGYANLMILSSMLNNEEEAVSFEDFKRYSSHCFIIAYGEGGWMDSELVNDNREQVYEKLSIMKKELPPFDVALSYQDASLWKMRNKILKNIATRLSIPVVALNKIYYLEKEDVSSYHILNAIRLNKMVNDSSLPQLTGRYFLSLKEMADLYEPEELERTETIARQCNADGMVEKTGLPAFQGKYDVSSKEYLVRLCQAGLQKRLNGRVTQQYQSRLRYELDIILKMHFEDYFLIVYDFIRYARKQDILVGPGRGSAAGSLVAYCLGITQIDPLKYHLLFERFLNPDRVSMPDIDTDIPDNRRQEVIRYVVDTYGQDHVANIITFGTLGARQVIRDVARTMNMNQRDVDTVLKALGNAANTTLQQAFENNAKFKKAVMASRNNQILYEMAAKIEGLPRHSSIHAAGIVLSSKPLKEVIPTIRMDEGISTSQYTMEYLEERGLIKMDFLGLRNLTIIDDIVKSIQKDDPSFRLMDIPLDDRETFRLFAKADTLGVFQFESEGMKSLLRRMEPACFDDIVACLALYRPASKDNIPLYVANKKEPDRITYVAEQLEPVLKETYGVMIYQEQAMLTARIAAGFTLAKADVLRKAMSKKNEKELANLQEDFIKGCLRNGYTEAKAHELFDLVDRFGGYGFNKSHAVAYGLVCYQMGYLKARYPLYFYVSLLDGAIGDSVKTSLYVDECRRRGIQILPPDVNRSGTGSERFDKGIILPLSVIKGIGTHVSQLLMEDRADRGLFTDFFDFVARAMALKINRSTMETLIDAGALDCLQENRKTMREGLEEAMRYGDLVQIHEGNAIVLDLDLVSKPVLVKMKETVEERSEREKEALGFHLSDHPVQIMRQNYGIDDPSIASFVGRKGEVTGFGVITGVHTHRTKYGDMMAFLKVSDETGQAEIAVMPDLYKQNAGMMVRGTYLRFRAKINEDGSMRALKIRIIKKSE